MCIVPDMNMNLSHHEMSMPSLLLNLNVSAKNRGTGDRSKNDIWNANCIILKKKKNVDVIFVILVHTWSQMTAI